MGDHVPSTLLENREIVLEGIKQNWEALTRGAEELRGDREIMMEAVRRDGSGQALTYARKDLFDDRKLMFEAVRLNGLLFEYASDELRASRDLAMLAVTRN